jgi:hypothetical protein
MQDTALIQNLKKKRSKWISFCRPIRFSGGNRLFIIYTLKGQKREMNGLVVN